MAVGCRLAVWGALVLVLSSVMGKEGEKEPQVIFLEPKEGAVISPETETVTIHFRVVSPDGINLMRYEVLVDGILATLEPFPIDPPAPEALLAIEWHHVKKFPDGPHTITVRVVDAKGREGIGVLTLYKGYAPRKPRVQILRPKSGEVVRGKVPVLIRAEDDKGLRVLRLRAKRERQEVTIILKTLRGRSQEVTVVWDTRIVDPATKKPLFPDGLYILYARVLDEEGNEARSNGVLVTVQNRVAQPIISETHPLPPARGGAFLPSPPSGPRSSPSAPGGRESPQTKVTLAPVPVHPRRPLSLPEPAVTTPEAPVVEMEGKKRPRQDALMVPIPAQERPYAALVLPPAPSPSRAVVKGTLPIPQSRPPRPFLPPTPSRPRILTALPSQGRRTVPLALTPSSPRKATRLPRPSGITPPFRPETPLYPSSFPLLAELPLPQRQLRPAPEVPKPVPFLPSSPSAFETAPSPTPRPFTPIRPTHAFRYTVIAGDTLKGLAHRFGLPVHVLAAVNDLPPDAPLKIGQRLLIPARPVLVLVDGQRAECEVPAFIRDSQVVGPFRAVLEASGAVVGWDNERKEASASLGHLQIQVRIGEPSLQVNGERLPLRIPPFLLRNRTFLLLRPLAEAIGKTVHWKAGTLRIETPQR